MMRSLIIVAAFSATSPSFVQQRDVADFDVAGVKLGATPAEARAALTRAGYRISASTEIRSFEQDVAQETARRRGKPLPSTKAVGTSSLTAIGPHREYLEAKFFQRPGGSRVASVIVRVPQDMMTSEAFKAQIFAKYGAAHAIRGMGSEFYWCSARVARSCGVAYDPSLPRDNRQPRLYAALGERFLFLQAGSDAEAVVTRERETAIERLAPKIEKGAF